jgi:hypothetical protein
MGGLISGSEKERFECAIGTSVLLTLLFAYDGFILGLPQVDFWTCLVLPHALIALAIVGVVWKRGLLHEQPVTYAFGFMGILALAMVHQQNFLRNQREWRGISLVTALIGGITTMLSYAIEQKEGGIVTIEDGSQFLVKERWEAVGNVIKDYWETFINYTQHHVPHVP